jgi:hypothetical protein
MRKSAVHFSADWLEHAANVSPEERATVCDLRIWIGGQNVCLHIEGASAEPFDHITVPAYPLAEGLTLGWWNIFGGRDREFRLFHVRTGYAVPDVRMRFDGSVFDATAFQYVYQNPDVRFWSGPTEALPRPEAERSLSAFIDAVSSRLSEERLAETTVQRRWARVRESLANPDEATYCEAAGALGVDPYKISEQDAAYIESAGALFSDEALIEFLAGVAAQRASADTLAWVRAAEKRPAYQSRLGELSGLAGQIERDVPTRPTERAWALGYRRANRARVELGLSQRSRITSVSAMAAALGNKAFRRAPSTRGLRALVSTRPDGVHVHLRDRRANPNARESELFTFARAIGEAVCYPETSRSVVNELHYAERQAAGRAFAAQFLAPVDEVLSMKADGYDNAGIADELGVSGEVVDRQLENTDRIRESVAE